MLDIGVYTIIAVSAALGAMFAFIIFGCVCCYKSLGIKFEEFKNDEESHDTAPRPDKAYSFTEHDIDMALPSPTENQLSNINVPEPTFLVAPDECSLRPRIAPLNKEKLGTEALVESTRYQFPRNQLQFVNELGDAWYGKALLGDAQKIVSGVRRSKVSIRMLDSVASTEDKIVFVQDILPFREIDHPNVMKLLGMCIESVPVLMVTEYFQLGDLKDFVRKYRHSEVQALNSRGTLLKFASDMAAGLSCLHQHHFVHHDFAIRNCMVAMDMCVKIGDYGISEEKYKDDYYYQHGDDYGQPIPLRWCAPETIKSNNGHVYMCNVNESANIWSFGIALWEIISLGSQPYWELTDGALLENIFMKQYVQPPLPNNQLEFKEHLYEIATSCLVVSDNRPSLSQIYQKLRDVKKMQESSLFDDFEKKWSQTPSNKQPIIAQIGSQSPTFPNVPNNTPVSPTISPNRSEDSNLSTSPKVEIGMLDNAMFINGYKQKNETVFDLSLGPNAESNEIKSEPNEINILELDITTMVKEMGDTLPVQLRDKKSGSPAFPGTEHHELMMSSKRDSIELPDESAKKVIRPLSLDFSAPLRTSLEEPLTLDDIMKGGNDTELLDVPDKDLGEGLSPGTRKKIGIALEFSEPMEDLPSPDDTRSRTESTDSKTFFGERYPSLEDLEKVKEDIPPVLLDPTSVEDCSVQVEGASAPVDVKGVIKKPGKRPRRSSKRNHVSFGSEVVRTFDTSESDSDIGSFVSTDEEGEIVSPSDFMSTDQLLKHIERLDENEMVKNETDQKSVDDQKISETQNNMASNDDQNNVSGDQNLAPKPEMENITTSTHVQNDKMENNDKIN